MSVNIKADYRNKQVFVKIDRLASQSSRAIRQGFFKFGKELVNTSRRLIIDPPKTGNLYRVAGRKRRHRASAPGQAPANLTGALQRSIDYKVYGSSQMEFGSNPSKTSGDSGRTARYAKELENGSKRIRGRRPYLETSVRKNAGNGRKHFESELRKALKK
jgi:hypothetical protein